MNIIPAELILMALGLIGSYFLIVTLMQIMLQALSYRRFQLSKKKHSHTLPSLTLLMPVRNEAKVVVESLHRALALPLEKFEIIVIENASTDQTYSLLHEEFQLQPHGDPDIFYSSLHPHLKVIRSSIPGKALALNLALPYVQTEIVATLDADTIPDAQGLTRLLGEFSLRPHVEAIGGIVRVLDPNLAPHEQKRPPRGWSLGLQSLEYLRAFSGERLGWGLLRSNVYMSGATALFRTQTLKKRSGFQVDTVTEDLETSLDLVAGAHGGAHPIDILPVVVCWTQVPTTLGDLFKQRRRWQAGLCQCLWKYRGLFFTNSRGLVGTLTLPYMLFTEALGPLIELLALMTLGHALFYEMIEVTPVITIAIIGLIISAGLVTWTAAVENRFLGQEARWSVLKVFVLSFPLNLMYRPIVNLIRIEACLRFPWFRSWGSIQRSQLMHVATSAK